MTPPPPSHTAGRQQEEIGGTPNGAKKPWSKPTVLRILDGAVAVASGPVQDPAINVENPNYQTPS